MRGSVNREFGEFGREKIADVCRGKLLAKVPKGEDGVWPNEIVQAVMEELKSKNISIGARTGLYNAHGIHWCREGRDQERELAEMYRGWAEALQFTYPFLTSTL